MVGGLVVLSQCGFLIQLFVVFPSNIMKSKWTVTFRYEQSYKGLTYQLLMHK